MQHCDAGAIVIEVGKHLKADAQSTLHFGRWSAIGKAKKGDTFIWLRRTVRNEHRGEFLRGLHEEITHVMHTTAWHSTSFEVQVATRGDKRYFDSKVQEFLETPLQSTQGRLRNFPPMLVL